MTDMTNWNSDDWHLLLSQYLDSRANFPNGIATVSLLIAESMEALRAPRAKKRGWTAEKQTGDLVAAIAHFNARLPGWWFSVGACHVSADATVAPDTTGIDECLFQTGDKAVTKFFDSGFEVDLHPPATMADALIRATDMAAAARDAYYVRNRLTDAIATLTNGGKR